MVYAGDFGSVSVFASSIQAGTGRIYHIELLSRLPSREGKVAFLVRNLSENSLGIYFVHVVIFWGIRRAMAETAWGWPFKFVAAFMGAWLVSWGLVQLLSQIPGVGWLLFHRPRRKGRSRQQG